jgi:hypothetical protein
MSAIAPSQRTAPACRTSRTRKAATDDLKTQRREINRLWSGGSLRAQVLGATKDTLLPIA